MAVPISRWTASQHGPAYDAFHAYEYARCTRAPFARGEPVIAQDPHAVYLYARDVLKQRFIEGESTIARDALFAYGYAKHILRGTFAAGEAAMCRRHSVASDYDRWISTLPPTMEILRSRCLFGCVLQYHHGQPVPLLERIHQLQGVTNTPPIAAHDLQQAMTLYQGFVQQMAWDDQITWLRAWCGGLTNPTTQLQPTLWPEDA